MADPYLFTVTNNVATFSINDAPWNLMSLEYIDRLEAQLPDVLADDTIRAMIFTGEGLGHFSAGMNLKQIPEGIRRAGSPEAFFGQRHRVLDMIENGGTPAIATLFGYCLGGGLELSLACHFRIAADTAAQICLPEIDLGSVPAWGGSARLPRAVGRTRALDMILRGRKIDGVIFDLDGPLLQLEGPEVEWTNGPQMQNVSPVILAMEARSSGDRCGDVRSTAGLPRLLE